MMADCLELVLIKVEYLAVLSVAFIQKLKELHEINEKLHECSGINSDGLWQVEPGKTFNIYEYPKIGLLAADPL